MADIGGEAGAGFAAKATSAVGGGVVWGIFVTMMLIIPTLFAGLLSPLLGKANKVIKDKVDTLPIGEPVKKSASGGKRSKAERLHQERLAELEAQREEQELAEKLARLKARRQKSSRQSASATVI